MLRLMLSTCLFMLGILPLASVAQSTRPNVLFIAVDDLRPQLGCYGADQMVTPNIDRLAKDGVLFRRAYCQVAVCGASRASLLSGCRPETTGCWDFKTPLRSKMPDVITLPQSFKEAGYQTSFIGKVYHSSSDDRESWTVSAKSVVPPGPGKVRNLFLARESCGRQENASCGWHAVLQRHGKWRCGAGRCLQRRTQHLAGD